MAALRGGTVALLFGREDAGLPNEALDQAHVVVTIPTTDHASLNLAQAALIGLYELHLAAEDATRELAPPRKDAPRAASRVESESWDGVDRELFERLRAVRLETARSRGVPPYVIFHDATMREIAKVKPGSLDDLRGVAGVGEKKLETYGEEIVALIAELA